MAHLADHVDELDAPWRRDAACRSYPDPDVFFDSDRTREARLVCRDCPVTVDCLTYSFASDSQFGVWGGVTPNSRRLMRRRLG